MVKIGASGVDGQVWILCVDPLGMDPGFGFQRAPKGSHRVKLIIGSDLKLIMFMIE